ncbi:MAG: hypothetical protein CMF74_00710 [Maricaulis sp.]|nr:hypothetical protein [Maricaulis sp.]
MFQSLIVLDDVLPDAMRVRDAALKLDYPEPGPGAHYPGRNSATSLRLPELDAQISAIVGETLVPGTPDHGRFRITRAGEQSDLDIHVDQCHWSGIFYLTRPEDCQGGTDFFRHKGTGADHAPYSQKHLSDWGFASYREFVERVSKPHSRDRSQWDHLMRVPMKFNRLVLFRPWLWHTAGPAFGDCPENARLIYLMFFNSEGPLRT